MNEAAEGSSRLHRVLVAVAVLCMAAAALLTFFPVRDMEAQARKLSAKAIQKEQLIDQLWQNLARQERQTDTALLLWQQRGASEAYAHYLQHLGKAAKTKPAALLEQQSKARAALIEQVDEIYAEHLSLKQRAMEADGDKETLAFVAFFLQLSGLVLVILIREIP